MALNFNKAEFVRSAGEPKDFLRDGLPQFAFAGRSNVGKSSVINRLVGRKNLAYVGSSPGKTTHINYFRLDGRAYLVDLPGYGYAKVARSEKERWAALIEKYFQADRNLGLVFQLIDMRHPPTRLDLDMTNYLIECELPFAVILTKADKLNKTQTSERLKAIRSELPYGDQLTILPCSSQSGAGIEQMRELIEEIVGQDAV